MVVLYRVTYNYDEIFDPNDNRTRREKTEYYGTSKHLKDYLKDNIITLLEGDLGNKIFISLEIEPVDAIFLGDV